MKIYKTQCLPHDNILQLEGVSFVIIIIIVIVITLLCNVAACLSPAGKFIPLNSPKS